MIDSIKRSASTRTISSKQQSNKSIKKESTPALDISLVNSIIAELKQDEMPISSENIQKRIIYRTLTDVMDINISQEPKFNKLYHYIDDALSTNKKAQQLIDKAISLYHKN